MPFFFFFVSRFPFEVLLLVSLVFRFFFFFRVELSVLENL